MIQRNLAIGNTFSDSFRPSLHCNTLFTMKNIYCVTGSMKLIRDFTFAFITLCIYVVQLS